MQTASVDKTIGDIQKTAERIKNDDPQRFPEAASPGDSFRQGDLYITLLERVPDNCKPMGKSRAQLAEGETQGSRHCLDSLEGVRMYERIGDQLLGPVFCIEAPERTVTHPEHGNVTLPGNGRVYGVSYQRDLDEMERERRVAD